MSVVFAFDIEYDGDKILCACTAWSNGMVCVPQLWSSSTKDGFCQLQPLQFEALLDTLWAAHLSGCVVATWGGTGSDWPVMLKNAQSDEQREKIRILAREHVDIPLISSAANGMMMGLVPAALGMGLGSRPACESEDVPRFWNSGDPARQDEVLEHVLWDSKTLAQIYFKLFFAAQGGRPALHWITQKSGPRTVRLQRSRVEMPPGEEEERWQLPPVKEVMAWPDPQANFEIPPHLNAKKICEWLY